MWEKMGETASVVGVPLANFPIYHYCCDNFLQKTMNFEDFCGEEFYLVFIYDGTFFFLEYLYIIYTCKLISHSNIPVSSDHINFFKNMQLTSSLPLSSPLSFPPPLSSSSLSPLSGRLRYATESGQARVIQQSGFGCKGASIPFKEATKFTSELVLAIY